MAQYATAANLATFLDVTFDAGDTTRANLLLEAVSDEIQSWCTRDDFEQTASDVVTLRGVWSHRLYLPKGPITSVASVVLNNTTLNSSSYAIVGRSLVRRAALESTFGDPIIRGLHWGGPDRTVVVTYTHGWTAVPDVVEKVTLRAAARAWINPEQRRSVSLETGHRVEFTDLAGTYLTAGDLRQLEKFRLTEANAA